MIDPRSADDEELRKLLLPLVYRYPHPEVKIYLEKRRTLVRKFWKKRRATNPREFIICDCGVAFYQKRSNQKHCSRRCKDRVNMREYRRRKK